MATFCSYALKACILMYLNTFSPYTLHYSYFSIIPCLILLLCAYLVLRHPLLSLTLSLLRSLFMYSHVNLNVKLDNVICALVDFLKASHQVKFLISLMLILQHNKREILLCPSCACDAQAKMFVDKKYFKPESNKKTKLLL